MHQRSRRKGTLRARETSATGQSGECQQHVCDPHSHDGVQYVQWAEVVEDETEQEIMFLGRGVRGPKQAKGTVNSD